MTHERMRLSKYEIGITVHRRHRSADRAQHVAVAHEAGRRQRLWPQVLDPLDYERALKSAEPQPDIPLDRGRRGVDKNRIEPAATQQPAADDDAEIGRASCRERVWQYV